MSASLTGIVTRPYIGVPYAFPVLHCTPASKSPRAIPIMIDWNVYWQAAGNPSNVGVQVDLSLLSPGASARGAFEQGDIQLDAVRAIKIDNSQSTVPIFVAFPDTQDVITCPPQTIVTQPVMTSAKTFIVYAKGLLTGFIPVTQLFVLNVPVSPSVDAAIQLTFPQWIGSPSIQRANALTPGYAPPALGDQTVQQDFALNNNTGQPIWVLQPLVNGFYYITAVCLNIFNNYNTNPIPPSDQGAILASGSTPIYHWKWWVNSYPVGNFDPVHMTTVFSQSGLQLRLDATKQVTIATADNLSISGTGQLILNYTYNPN